MLRDAGGDVMEYAVRRLMPLYEYQCEACGHRFEVIQKFSDDLVERLPVLREGPGREAAVLAGDQFKGSGWYITDYARKDSGKGAKNSGKDSSGKQDSGKSSGSSSGSSNAGKSTSPSTSDSSKTPPRPPRPNKSDTKSGT